MELTSFNDPKVEHQSHIMETTNLLLKNISSIPKYSVKYYMLSSTHFRVVVFASDLIFTVVLSFGKVRPAFLPGLTVQ